MKRQRARLRQVVKEAQQNGARNGQAPPQADSHAYEDPREMAEVLLILAQDAPETLPGATRETFDDAPQDELRRLAEVGCAESVLEHPPGDEEARKRAAEGVAAIMKKYPEAWNLSGDSPADYTEDELREAALSVMKQAAAGPPPGEGPEPPENPD